MFHIIIRPYEHYLWWYWESGLHFLALHANLFLTIDPLVGREGFYIISLSHLVCLWHLLVLSLLRLVVAIVGFKNLSKVIWNYHVMNFFLWLVEMKRLEQYFLFPFGHIKKLGTVQSELSPHVVQFCESSLIRVG